MKLSELGLVGDYQRSSIGAARTCGRACHVSIHASVFASLLDAERGGEFAITSADGSNGTQRYLPNTNILETRFASADGAFRILDFAPRLEQHGNTFRSPATGGHIVSLYMSGLLGLEDLGRRLVPGAWLWKGWV